jgi:hypothetical protein
VNPEFGSSTCRRRLTRLQRPLPLPHPSLTHPSHPQPHHPSYAEYETKLEQLRQARRHALGLAGAKQTLADYAIVKRVHFIFERAARKFKRDLGVWTRWLEYCRATRSNRRLSRVAARALQLHPNAPGLWTYAAAWEFEENANPGAARALMQQGLRMCKDSRQMWLQYLDMVGGWFGAGEGKLGDGEWVQYARYCYQTPHL